MKQFTRVGPVQGPGAMAYEYHCVDCGYILVTVAATDLLPENRNTLEDHAFNEHGVLL